MLKAAPDFKPISYQALQDDDIIMIYSDILNKIWYGTVVIQADHLGVRRAYFRDGDGLWCIYACDQIFIDHVRTGDKF